MHVHKCIHTDLNTVHHQTNSQTSSHTHTDTHTQTHTHKHTLFVTNVSDSPLVHLANLHFGHAASRGWLLKDSLFLSVPSPLCSFKCFIQTCTQAHNRAAAKGSVYPDIHT